MGERIRHLCKFSCRRETKHGEQDVARPRMWARSRELQRLRHTCVPGVGKLLNGRGQLGGRIRPIRANLGMGDGSQVNHRDEQSRHKAIGIRFGELAQKKRGLPQRAPESPVTFPLIMEMVLPKLVPSYAGRSTTVLWRRFATQTAWCGGKVDGCSGNDDIRSHTRAGIHQWVQRRRIGRVSRGCAIAVCKWMAGL